VGGKALPSLARLLAGADPELSALRFVIDMLDVG